MTLENFPDIILPLQIPAVVKPTINNKNDQSIVKWLRSAVKPVSDFIAMINNDVPTAILKGKPAIKMRAGKSKKPPPMPTIPVNSPISDPKTIM